MKTACNVAFCNVRHKIFARARYFFIFFQYLCAKNASGVFRNRT